MIRVTLAPEPPNFDDDVRKLGHRKLELAVAKAGVASAADLSSVLFPPVWRSCLPDLKRSYERICAYSCFYIEPVTGAASVDHFVPKSRDWQRAYDWENYRLCCQAMNSSKRDYSTILDPFEIEDDWFHLELVGFQTVPNPALPPEVQQRIIVTRDTLQLNRHECRERREEEATQIEMAPDLEARQRLERKAPFVSRELRRQGRLPRIQPW